MIMLLAPGVVGYMLPKYWVDAPRADPQGGDHRTAFPTAST